MSFWEKVISDDLVVRDGCEVRVRIVYPFGEVPRRSVAISATVPGAKMLHFRARAGSYFIAAGRQDAVTGHSTFDDRFIVKTSDVDLMRLWFTATELDAILATYDPLVVVPFEVELEDGVVTFTANESADDSLIGVGLQLPPVRPIEITRLEAAITAAAIIAGRAERVAAEWRKVAGAIGGTVLGAAWTGDDGFAISVARERHAIRIDFPLAIEWSTRQSLRTRVSCPRLEPGARAVALWQPDLPRASLKKVPIDDGHSVDAIGSLIGTIAEAYRPAPGPLDLRTTAADIDWIVVDETTITAGWERLIQDPTRLTAGIDLVAALATWIAPASPVDGPYR